MAWSFCCQSGLNMISWSRTVVNVGAGRRYTQFIMLSLFYNRNVSFVRSHSTGISLWSSYLFIVCFMLMLFWFSFYTCEVSTLSLDRWMEIKFCFVWNYVWHRLNRFTYGYRTSDTWLIILLYESMTFDFFSILSLLSLQWFKVCDLVEGDLDQDPLNSHIFYRYRPIAFFWSGESSWTFSALGKVERWAGLLPAETTGVLHPSLIPETRGTRC